MSDASRHQASGKRAARASPTAAGYTLARVLEKVAKFLPPKLEPGDIEQAVLLRRSFDRARGQLIFVLRKDRTLVVLSRPSGYARFRAIPLAERHAVSVSRGEAGAKVDVRVVDGKVLTLALEPDEGEELHRIVAASRRTSSRPALARATVRPPESAPAEVVVVREGLVRTPTPMPLRDASNAPAVTRATPSDAVASASRLGSEPSTAPSSANAPSPAPTGEERPSAIPPALTPSPEALANSRGTPPSRRKTSSGRHSSVHPPALTPSAEFSLEEPTTSGAHDVAVLRARLRDSWERGELDAACQLARAVAFLSTPDPLEKRLASLEAPSLLGRSIAPHLFEAYVAHHDEDPDVGWLFVALWPALLTMRLRPEREMGLRPRDLVEVATAERGLGSLFRKVARTLSIPTPRLWVRMDVPGGLAHLNVSPLGSLSGSSLVQNFTEVEQTFVVAHHLSFYRPEVYLTVLLPSPSDLLVLACAGLYLERRMPPDPRIVKVAHAIEPFMVPQVRDSLRAACAELRLASGDVRTALSTSIESFRRGALFTAARVGYLMTGSLPLSARMTRLLPSQPGISADEIIDDVVAFSISAACLTLRRELGVALSSGTSSTT